jgi:predicted secreted protein with PEFG-CTERM motif
MRNLTVLSLFVILVASIGAIPAFAQSADITVSTDKGSYSDGEAVMVSGQVNQLLGVPVSLIVIAPNGNIVTIVQIDVGSDNTFSVEITAGGNLWRAAGTYTVEASYGLTAKNTSTASTTFEFGGSSGGKPSTTIGVDGTDFLLSYTITGGKVLSIMPDVAANSLVIAIETTNDGQLTITLPRALIDALLPDGGDDSFFVQVHGEERDFDETKTDTDRTLTIAFEQGAEKIEIFGTFVVPEFGTVAALILAVAIISIIAVSARSRLNVLPKY